MEEFIKLLTDASPAAAVMIIALVVIRFTGRQAESNSRQADAVQGNMTAMITLSGKISDNSDRVSDAVEKFAKGTMEAFKVIGATMSIASIQAEKNETARVSTAKDINAKLTNITAVLDALTDQCRSLATKEDIFNLAGTLEILNAISDTLAEIKVRLVNNV